MTMVILCTIQQMRPLHYYTPIMLGINSVLQTTHFHLLPNMIYLHSPHTSSCRFITHKDRVLFIYGAGVEPSRLLLPPCIGLLY
jgi:hypothetical protein